MCSFAVFGKIKMILNQMRRYFLMDFFMH